MQSSTISQLRELKELLDEGILTQEEFDAQKAKILVGGEGVTNAGGDARAPARSVPSTVASVTAFNCGGVTMVTIPGTRMMMGATPVTQGLWEKVMDGNPSARKGADLPVENVSWDDCQKFIEALNARPKVIESDVKYRLPTSDEWEHACRAGATGDFCRLADGTEINQNTLEDVAWYNGDSNDTTHPVGQKKPNAFGLYDMLGNVWEWTASGDDSFKHYCGGAYNSPIRLCTAASTQKKFHDYRDSNCSFRLAAERERMEKDFDNAVEIGEEITRQVADLGDAVTPIGFELIIANMLIACFFPAVWVAVVLFYVTAIGAGVKRHGARKALKAHDLPAAKVAIASAKGWHAAFVLTQIAMGVIEMWAILHAIDAFKNGMS